MAENVEIICSMYKIHKKVAGKEILRDISLSYFYGAKIGVLGLNGAGKSTLLRIMAMRDTAFDGEFAYTKGYTIGMLDQEPVLNDAQTVREAVEESVAQWRALLDEYDQTFVDVAEVPEGPAQDKIYARQAELEHEINLRDLWNLDARLDMAMDALRCPDAEMRIGVLSGGERRRVALCRLLLQEPDVLLLDEPTNHLDAETITWLEQHLRRYKGTVIAVTHDRYFLDNVAGWILELDRGHGIPWKGNYSSWLEQKQKRLELEEKESSARQRALAREREWVAQSPKGRLAKGKARLNAYNALLEQNQTEAEAKAEIFIPPGPRLGDLVIRAESLGKRFGDKVLFENVNFNLPPGGIVGVIGANGAGKSTLFRMITNLEKVEEGSLRVGETVKIAYADQMRTLPADMPLWAAISDNEEFIELGKLRVNARAYCARFGFSGADQQKLVGALSGGERNRVHLARVLKSGANVIMLDEPTNDLDVNTIRALEDALNAFAGCAIVISHDRWFLDRIATHILAFEGDSTVYYHEGNFESYNEDYHKRYGRRADQPHRLKYRKLTR